MFITSSKDLKELQENFIMVAVSSHPLNEML